jgi:Zn-dependent protease
MGGPLIGTVGAVLCYLVGRHTDTSVLIAIAYAGLFLNLFNLLPVSPLDGGRITAIISPRVWLIGAPLMLAVLLYRPTPVLLMVAIIALPQLSAPGNTTRTRPRTSPITACRCRPSSNTAASISRSRPSLPS